MLRENGQLYRPVNISNGLRTLEIGNRAVEIHQTPDFPVEDPWSTHTRSVLQKLHEGDELRGNIFEAGVGDGRNLFAVDIHERGRGIPEVTGVDIDGWRLDLAKRNLAEARVSSERVVFHQGDVVDLLHRRTSGEPISGTGIACLPQAPMAETSNYADGFDPAQASLQGVKGLEIRGRSVDQYGLTLNAAFLEALRGRVARSNFTLLLTLSDRVPQDVREELFEKTGWRSVREFPTEKPVQQDPDTGVSYVAPYDDGNRFFEMTEGGMFVPISAREAEEKRIVSVQNGGRDTLNVHHHITVAQLVPDATKVYAKR